MATFTESVEVLKQQYTDKYVRVDARRPELARFADVVGQVKTVNMSGRALVEFLDYHLNIGWFDIDLSALTVVEKPTAESQAKAKTEKAAVKSAPAAKIADGGAKKLSPLEMARMQDQAKKAGAAAPAAKPAGKSTADILAAARGGAKPAAAAPAPAKPRPEAAVPKPAAAPAAGGEVVRVDKSGMSVEAMIAYCRTHDAH